MSFLGLYIAQREKDGGAGEKYGLESRMPLSTEILHFGLPPTSLPSLPWNAGGQLDESVLRPSVLRQ